MDIQKTEAFIKEQTKQSRKAHIKCPQEKFLQHCQNGILHIPKEHHQNSWKTPKIRVWLVNYNYQLEGRLVLELLDVS